MPILFYPKLDYKDVSRLELYIESVNIGVILI